MNTQEKFSSEDRFTVLSKYSDANGKEYARTVAGMVLRITPRPYYGKRGRRQEIYNRKHPF